MQESDTLFLQFSRISVAIFRGTSTLLLNITIKWWLMVWNSRGCHNVLKPNVFLDCFKTKYKILKKTSKPVTELSLFWQNTFQKNYFLVNHECLPVSHIKYQLATNDILSSLYKIINLTKWLAVIRIINKSGVIYRHVMEYREAKTEHCVISIRTYKEQKKETCLKLKTLNGCRREKTKSA